VKWIAHKEKPLATTIERDILPETLEIDGMTVVALDQPNDAPDPGIRT